MNYIYDIMLCPDNKLYDFYDWDNSKIIHVKKIPIFKVKTKQYKEIKNNNILLEESYRCELFNKKFINLVLVTNGKEIIAVSNNLKSNLLLDELEDILDDIDDIRITELKYKIVSKNNIVFNTRYEEERVNKIKENILSIYQNKEFDKLKYIYFELFNKKEEDIKKIVEDIINNINNYKLDELFRCIK